MKKVCVVCGQFKEHKAKGKCEQCYSWGKNRKYYSSPTNVKKHKQYYIDLRFKVLSHYSGGKPICSCCGEETIEFLSIDHINGIKNPTEQGRGKMLISWLKKYKFPSGYRVLCYNCNLSIGFNGYCPHKEVLKR